MREEYKDVSILLVEDDDVDALAVRRALRKLKIANPLLRVKNGIEALSTLRGNEKNPPLARPYIVLLDLNMPQMNGIEFLHELRRDPAIADAVVFVLTTSAADEDKVAAYKEHIAGYIVKSNAKEDFSKVVEMLDHYWRIVALPV